jgi:hypothetical protein
MTFASLSLWEHKHDPSNTSISLCYGKTSLLNPEGKGKIFGSVLSRNALGWHDVADPGSSVAVREKNNIACHSMSRTNSSSSRPAM